MKVRGEYVVYLSGAMFQDCPEQETWRVHAATFLERNGVQVLNPYRGRDVRGTITKVGSYHYTESTAPVKNKLANLLVNRDLKDVGDCDLLLVNLQDTKNERPSIGTISELAWAHLMNKPVICIIDEKTTEDDYYKHPFMHVFISQWVSSVEEGIEAILYFWHPDADKKSSRLIVEKQRGI
jgi:nucleoside 2-deoxyribosyltransferase